MRQDPHDPLALYDRIIGAGRALGFWYRDEPEVATVVELMDRLSKARMERWNKTRTLALMGRPVLGLAGESAATILGKRLGIVWRPQDVAVLPHSTHWEDWEEAIALSFIDRRMAGAMILINLMMVAITRPDINAREVIAINAFRMATRQPCDLESVVQTSVSFYRYRCKSEDLAGLWDEHGNLEHFRIFLLEVQAYLARTELAAEALDKIIDQLREACVSLAERVATRPDLQFILEETEAMIERRRLTQAEQV